MSNYQDQMMALLQRAYDEGEAQASQSSPSQPTSADTIPVHNIENPATRLYFDEMETILQAGYAQSDYSRVWPYSTCVQDSSKKYSVTELCWPYCIHGNGTKVIVECPGEPTQTVTPYKTLFRIYALTPGKTYTWKMYSSAGKVIKSGSFRCVGRIRWMGTKDTRYPFNFRDVGGTWPSGSMNFGRIYRSKNPDDIEVESLDHMFLRDQLRITVQLNLRDGSKSGDEARDDIFAHTYSYNIPAYAQILSANTAAKGNWAAAFRALLTELQAGRNILINCEAGADRTGSFCWWLQALCHMPAGFLEAHWESTTFQRDQNSMIWEETGDGGKLRVMVSKFTAKWGPDPYEQALGLASFFGITPAEIADFQSIMMA